MFNGNPYRCYSLFALERNISSVKTADKNQFPTVAKATDKKIHNFQLSFVRVSQPLAVFTLETDGPSETGFEDGLTVSDGSSVSSAKTACVCYSI